MTDDLLRLRTARALGWVCVRERMGVLGSVYQRWEKDGTLATTVTFMNDDIAYDVIRYDGPMPAYGESWASCKEIDEAIREEEWKAQIDLDGNETRVLLFTTVNGLIHTRLSAATAPTFPEAFALAFCEAAELPAEDRVTPEPPPSHLEAILAERERLKESLRKAVEWLDSEQDPAAVLHHLGIHLKERLGGISVGFSPEAYKGLPVVVFTASHSPTTPFTAEDVTVMRAIVEEVAEVHSDWNGEGTRSYNIALNHRAGPAIQQCLNNYHAAGSKIFDTDWCQEQVRPMIPEGWA